MKRLFGEGLIINRDKQKSQKIVSLFLVLLLLTACGGTKEKRESDPTELPVLTELNPEPTEPLETKEPQQTEVELETEQVVIPKCIVIDPGHQKKADLEKEPLGPGSSEMKMRVSGGTQGRTSGYPEYELNLVVSMFLREELESRGYLVVMTRETHDVNISNAERAALANDLNADAFIRVHANGSDNSSDHGVLMLNMTASNRFNSDLYKQSRALSDAIGAAVVAETGAANRGIWETDTMTGINWCQVPVTILEMGFMTNADEEALLVTEEYQRKIARGTANGIDAFFEAQEQYENQQHNSLLGLDEKINDIIGNLDSSWEVLVEDLSSGVSSYCTQNVNGPMVSASLIKLFIMGTTFDRISHGEIDYADVKADLRKMICISDNTSANNLTTLLGNGDADQGRKMINEWAASIGCQDVAYNRLMLVDNGLQNYVSAADCVLILRSIYNEECVSPEYSKEMLNLLKQQEINTHLSRGIPDSVVLAHKTGDLWQICVADVGIVFEDGMDYAICVICNNPYNNQNASDVVAKLSSTIYQYMSFVYDGYDNMP